MILTQAAPQPWTWWGVPWADALAGIGTMLAVMIALWFSLRDHRARTRALEVEQASRVSAFVTVVNEAELPSGNTHRAVALQVFNASGAPVYMVRAVFTDHGGVAQGAPRVVTSSLVPSRESPTVVVVRLVDENDHGPREIPRLFFRDAAGRHWMRDEVGNLTKLKEPNLAASPAELLALG